MWANIVNPISGKKVSIYGKIGKKVISQYLKQIGGGKNPHTGKEWSSYTCKKLNEDKCEDYTNWERCIWVEKTDKKKAHCKKSKRANRKRGQRNWKKLKEEFNERAGIDLQNNTLSDDEISKLLENQYIDSESEQGKKIIADLKRFTYNPNYRSKFGTGDLINKYSRYAWWSVLYNQAEDALAAHVTYGDNLTNESWDSEEDNDSNEEPSLDNEQTDEKTTDSYTDFLKEMDEEDEANQANQSKLEEDNVEYLKQNELLDSRFDGITDDEIQSEYDNYLDDTRERQEYYHGF